jgi:hypothetical protein
MDSFLTQPRKLRLCGKWSHFGVTRVTSPARIKPILMQTRKPGTGGIPNALCAMLGMRTINARREGERRRHDDVARDALWLVADIFRR